MANDSDGPGGLFPALLRQWRHRRGLSQLDLALVAGVSARHLSFLETGRSRPSPEMARRLGTALGLGLRQVNSLLRAAGHPPAYAEELAIPSSVAAAIEVMASHHDPLPLIVIDRAYRILDLNRGARLLLSSLSGTSAPDTDPRGLNLARLAFDPAGAAPHIVNFEHAGREMLWRLQREVLADPDETALSELLEELLALPTVDRDWRAVDLSVPGDPALVLHLRTGGTELRFLTTVTSFQAPQNVVTDELRIESWYPADAETAAAWARLIEAHDPS